MHSLFLKILTLNFLIWLTSLSNAQSVSDSSFHSALGLTSSTLVKNHSSVISFSSKDLAATSPGSYSTYIFTGFLPEIRYNRGKHVGASYSIMSLAGGFGVVGGGLSVGIDGDVQNNVYETKVSLWLASHLILVGANAKLSFTRSFLPQSKRASSIRPELGLAIGPIFFNYGFDIFLGPKPDELGRHNFIMTTYIPLFMISEQSSYQIPTYAY